jgi:glycosyltransferase involved in cell wall biosynthesis
MAGKPPKMAQIDSEMGFSGGEVQVFLEMEELRARGHDQVLIAPPGSASARLAAERGFPVREVPMRADGDLPALFRLGRALRGIDLVHVHTSRAAWLAGFACWRRKIPCVITRRMDRRVRRGLQTRLIYHRFSQCTAAISPAVRQCLLDGGVEPQRIELVPEAVDPERIRVRRSRDATRAELQLAPGQFGVLVMAALVHRKGHDLLLQAFAQLDDQNAVLLCAGAGPELANLHRQAEQLGIAARVRFLGQRNDPGDLLHAADLFVLPSRAEGLGVAALEALGAGCPVIATRVGGLADVVLDGQCGLLVPPEDSRTLAAAMQRLREDADLRLRLGAAGPARIDMGYRPAQMASSYERLFARVLGGTGRA